ncbi:MAG TPA: glycosyltransferase [Rhizomicrobium sp.]|nr:glycosyltransferase [Rhizomicrobium sp.]
MAIAPSPPDAYLSAMTRVCAPIALFVYARQDHLRRTVEALKHNALAAESELIIFSDGPKSPAAHEAVRAVRDYVRTIQGFKSVTVFEQERNLGLAASIIGGVTKVCESHGRVIVMEDDLVSSPHFLSFMNDALIYYEEVPQVAAISGYHPPFDAELPETFFQCDAECWGWATWKRAWRSFNPDGRALLSELKRRKLLRMFDQEASYPYVRMLEDQIAGRNDSWAIRWRASVILNNMLSLYPRRSLIQNIGLDGSGTHGEAPVIQGDEGESAAVNVDAIPLVHSDQALQAFAKFNRRLHRRGFRDRVLRRLGKLVTGSDR